MAEGLGSISDITRYSADKVDDYYIKIYIRKKTNGKPRNELPIYFSILKENGGDINSYRNSAFWHNLPLFRVNHLKGIYNKSKIDIWPIDLLFIRRQVIKIEGKLEDAKSLEDMIRPEQIHEKEQK